MKFVISGKNIDVTEGLRKAVEDKLGKLERYFTSDTEVIVTLSVEKERQKIEVTIPVKGNIIRSEQVSSDMYVSIDLVEEVIERQLKKYKNKIVSKQQNAAAFAQEFVDKDYEDEDEFEDDNNNLITTGNVDFLKQFDDYYYSKSKLFDEYLEKIKINNPKLYDEYKNQSSNEMNEDNVTNFLNDINITGLISNLSLEFTFIPYFLCGVNLLNYNIPYCFSTSKIILNR